MENKSNTDKLIGKIIITGEIIVKTGLAIGGNKSGIDIGGLDNPVIKTYQGIPYIPGSSLKGKMRALIARVAGTRTVNDDVKMSNTQNEYRHLATVFGFGANDVKKKEEDKEKEKEQKGEALLKVRDSYVKDSGSNVVLTEEKTENTIDRITGKANPRPIERVVPDTIFKMEMYLDVYDKDKSKEYLKLILLAIELLKQDYLGGGGTRGHGRVDINKIKYQYYEVVKKELKAHDEVDSIENIFKKDESNHS
jgi:CRISPR-associated protein Csm3